MNWVKQFAGSGTEYPAAVTTDKSGNIYSTGRFGINGTDFDPDTGSFNMVSPGGWSAYISKLNPEGHFLWAKQIGGGVFKYVYAQGIAVDTLKNVLVVGRFEGTTDFDPGPGTYTMTAANAYDIFILKLDSLGNFIWAKRIGGAGYDYCNSIGIDWKQNIYLSGSFEQIVDFDPGIGVYNLNGGNGAMYISKLDTLGNFLWVKQFAAEVSESPNDLCVDKKGNVYSTGYFSGAVDFDPGSDTVMITSKGIDAFVLKLNKYGDYVWAKSFSGNSADKGVAIVVDTLGNVFSTGTFLDTADFDPGSSTFLLSTLGNTDIYVAKLDSIGNFVWARQLGGPDVNTCIALAIDSSFNLYSTGHFEGIIDLDPGPGNSSFNSPAIFNCYVSKLSANGNYLGAAQIASNSHNYAAAICIDPFSNAIVTGSFSGTSDFDPGISNYFLSPTSYDIFILKYGSATGVRNSKYNSFQISIFPNPVSRTLQFYLPIHSRYDFRLYNALGEIIINKEFQNSVELLDVQTFNEGIYIYEIRNLNSGERNSGKIMVKK